MDLMWIAITVHVVIAGLLGLAIVKIAGRRLPEPWNRKSFTVPVFLILGALVTIVSFTHWSIFPE